MRRIGFGVGVERRRRDIDVYFSVFSHVKSATVRTFAIQFGGRKDASVRVTFQFLYPNFSQPVLSRFACRPDRPRSRFAYSTRPADSSARLRLFFSGAYAYISRYLSSIKLVVVPL